MPSPGSERATLVPRHPLPRGQRGFRVLFRGWLGDAAMRFRPAGRVVHEFLDLRQHLRVELVARLGDCDDAPPGRERMQLDAEVAALGERESTYAIGISFSGIRLQ